MKGIILALIVALAGCGTTTVYVYPELPLPEWPVLPVVAGDDLACLSDATYEDLAVREKLRRGYAEQLRAIIEAHNAKR